MKIISLAGENLASLAAPFHIDFAQGVLADAGLFAISGNTGAGKSTLLDAICLALFDAMPRFSNSRRGAAIGHAHSDESDRVKSNDVRHILTRGAANGFAQVVFQLDSGEKYQAKWSVKRARNSAHGRLQAQEMELLDCKTAQVLATKKTEVLVLIESLIGLNYEQFRRSVLLAQGDFAAFLKAPAKERSELLERITGTGLYSQISKQAFAKAKEQEQALLLLESKLGEVKLLTGEEQEDLVNQLAGINEKITDAEHEKTSLTWLGDKIEQKVQLTRDLNDKKAQQQSAQAAIVQQQSVNQILDKIEKAQDARVVYAQQSKQQQAQLDQQRLIETLSSKHQQSVELHSQTSEQTQRLGQLQQQAQQQLEEKLPQIELAITKLAAVESQRAQQDSLNQQLSGLAQHSDDNAQKLTQFKTQLVNTTLEHDKLQKYLGEHQQIAPLVNQVGVIEQHIQEYGLGLSHIEALEEKLNSSKVTSETLNQQLHSLNQQLVSEQQQLQLAQRDHEQLTTLNATSDIDAIEQQLSAQQEQHNALINEQQLIVQGLQYQAMIAQKKQQQDEVNSELDQLRQSYRQTKNQLDQHMPLRDEALKALNTAKQVMSLSEHRHTLVDGEPCALCGSKEHPYSNEHSVGNEMIVQLSQRFEQLDEQAQQFQQQLTQFDAIGKQKAQQQQTLVHEINELTQLIKQLAVEEVSVERQGKVEQQLAQTLNMIEQHKAQIKQAQHLQNDLHQALQKLENAKHQSDKTRQELSSVQQQLSTLANDLTLGQQSIAQYQQQQDDRINALNSLYNAVNWHHVLSVDIELAAFKRELAMNIDGYVTAQENQLSLANQLTHIKQQIIVFEEQGAQLSQQQQPLQAQVQQLNEQITEELSKLQQLTGGEDPRALRETLEASVKELSIAHQNASATLSQQHSDCLVVDSQLKQAKEHLESLYANSQQLNLQWQEWQRAMNMSEQDLIDLLSYEQEWIIEQRQHQAQLLQTSHQAHAVVEQLTEQMAQLELTLDERSQDLQTLFPPLTPDPKLSSDEQRTMLAKSIDANLSQLSQQQFEIRAQLEQHNQGMVRFGELSGEIEAQKAQSQIWQNMKELIGSADGAKFRTFAQSLTLEQMLLGANHHLADLAPRYCLQRVPGAELELQMIDKDMGDEVRSIDSLSGGETFLVSLALALGLGSLTSLQTTIRSLFIDEGFGTLDPDTLEVALSCLDSLQASGRQIGIISHVQGLVERVGTRVQITSKGDGFSTIALLNR
ncbi:AAA family ATPase [Psychrobium sp. MM17-31]|uniref:AAA family ATPase n=1 Tax=Psychrobium sp. MM17-31 TaxID=2917758 RepID=UPI001EF5A7CC|nr:AAA family ATPase [Psychrobium sp. MM17-31]MCG7531248.1 AAA family ATPase [Psychrobium sp. MM17-31]